MVVPFSIPDKVSVSPAGVPDCTVNVRGPVTTLFVVVTFNVPLAVAPETKQEAGPPVMNSTLDTFNDPSPFTVNAVTKLNVEASPVPPVSTACQVPPAVVAAVVVLLPPPQPQRVNASARSATTASRFMFTLVLDWNATVHRDAGRQ
jgi:hypothetical protein